MMASARESAISAMPTLLLDLRYAVRMLLRQPVFALVALLTLALGIGANTAIFSIIDAVLLRPLPFPQAGRLVSVWAYGPGAAGHDQASPLAYPRFELIRAQQDVFEDLGATAYDDFTLTGRGDPAQIAGTYVSAGFLPTMGVRPLEGRLFLPGEDLQGGPHIVIVSRTFWQKYCGSDPSLVGQSLVLNGAPYTVVGIVETQVTYPLNNCNLFIPGVFIPDYPPAVIRQGGTYLSLTARLKPGISLERANEELRLLSARYQQAFPEHVETTSICRANSLQEEVVGDARPMFYTLAGAVGCTLLIACVNVANLLLARLAGRRKEIAIRAALGASRMRLARQFFTESLLLALLAGALGTLLALWCVDLARGLGPEAIPRATEIRLSGAALVFTLGISLAAGLLLGVIPALHAVRGNPGEALQQTESRGSAGGVRQSRTRGALLIAQVALCLVLLTGTGLLITSLWKLQSVPLGFNPNGVLTAEVNLPLVRYPKPEQQAAFFARLTERIDALPGVRRSAAASAGPLMGGLSMFYSVVGQPVPPVHRRPFARYSEVSPDYFATQETPIVEGRAFTERDRDGVPPVMIINQAMARRLFPNGGAVGQKLLCSNSNPTVTEIVGVMADARTTSLAHPARPEMYFSMFQRPELAMIVYVRAIRPEQAKGLGLAVQAAVRDLDPDQPVGEVVDMNTVVSRSLADRQLLALLLASFAGVALVLAAIGIYGVTAYGVAQRTREIGIRIALGAQSGDVFRLIIGGGMKLILVGIVLGVISALGLTRLLASLLYGIGAADPLIFAVVVGILIAVALVANFLPARRATRVDPLVALREE
jgi:predicted permease